MGDRIDTIQEQLASIQTQVETIEQQSESNSSDSSPPTTLEIIGADPTERIWQQYLKYFLNPNESHQLGNSFLTCFIKSLQASRIVRRSLNPNYSDVLIRDEVPAEDSRPDLLIYEPEKWFICFELKLGAAEGNGQTEDHVSSPVLGELKKSNAPSEHHYYLYIAPEWAGDGDAEEFEAYPWFKKGDGPSVARTVSTVLNEYPDEISTRTQVQLKEFHESIVNKLSMTSIDEETRELKQLYVKNKQYIDRLENAFEKYTEWFFDTRVPEALNGEYRPSFWNEEWEYNRYSGHTKIYHSSWRPGNDIDVHLEYYPRPEKLLEATIHIRFDIEYKGKEWTSDDGRRPQQVFADELLTHIDLTEFPDRTTITESEESRIHKFLDTHYEFEMDSEEDYLEALHRGLEDMSPVVPAVHQTLETWESERPDN